MISMYDSQFTTFCIVLFDVFCECVVCRFVLVRGSHTGRKFVMWFFCSGFVTSTNQTNTMSIQIAPICV